MASPSSIPSAVKALFAARAAAGSAPAQAAPAKPAPAKRAAPTLPEPPGRSRWQRRGLVLDILV